MKAIEFEGVTHEFPDDFTDEDIAAALSVAPARTPAGTDEDPLTDTNQLLGRRYPNNSEASALYNNPEAQAQAVAEGQKEAFRSQPVLDRAISGAGRFAYGFVPGKNARDQREIYDRSAAGDIPSIVGRIAPEVATAAAGGAAASGAAGVARIAHPIYRVLAGGAVSGIPSVAMHQAQSLASGEGFSPGSAAAEMGLSTAIPVIGSAAGQVLRNAAPNVLRSAVKPVLSQMDTPNPPNFENALERGLVPYFGGVDGASRNARGTVRELGVARDVAARAASVRNGRPARTVPFIGGAIQDTRAELGRIARTPGQQMLAGDQQEAAQALNFWQNEFRGRSTANRPGFMTPEDALGFRQRIDETINWRRANQQLSPGFERASQILRGRLNQWIERASPQVAEQTRELAGILPVTQALERRALQEGNNYRLGLLDLGALGAGGVVGGGAAGAAGAGAGTGAALAALAIRRLTSTPGGAAMMYDAGRSLSLPSPIRDMLLQTARSGINDAIQVPPYLRDQRNR